MVKIIGVSDVKSIDQATINTDFLQDLILINKKYNHSLNNFFGI